MNIILSAGRVTENSGSGFGLQTPETDRSSVVPGSSIQSCKPSTERECEVVLLEDELASGVSQSSLGVVEGDADDDTSTADTDRQFVVESADNDNCVNVSEEEDFVTKGNSATQNIEHQTAETDCHNTNCWTPDTQDRCCASRKSSQEENSTVIIGTVVPDDCAKTHTVEQCGTEHSQLSDVQRIAVVHEGTVSRAKSETTAAVVSEDNKDECPEHRLWCKAETFTNDEEATASNKYSACGSAAREQSQEHTSVDVHVPFPEEESEGKENRLRIHRLSDSSLDLSSAHRNLQKSFSEERPDTSPVDTSENSPKSTSCTELSRQQSKESQKRLLFRSLKQVVSHSAMKHYQMLCNTSGDILTNGTLARLSPESPSDQDKPLHRPTRPNTLPRQLNARSRPEIEVSASSVRILKIESPSVPEEANAPALVSPNSVKYELNTELYSPALSTKSLTVFKNSSASRSSSDEVFYHQSLDRSSKIRPRRRMKKCPSTDSKQKTPVKSPTEPHAVSCTTCQLSSDLPEVEDSGDEPDCGLCGSQFLPGGVFSSGTSPKQHDDFRRARRCRAAGS